MILIFVSLPSNYLGVGGVTAVPLDIYIYFGKLLDIFITIDLIIIYIIYYFRAAFHA